jgi:hypothetical protein
MSDFHFDASELQAGLKAAGDAGKKLARFAIWEAAAALKKDADEIVPRTPHLHGNLRGDTQRSVKAKGASNVRKEWWPKMENEDLGPDKYSIMVTYCAPYAERWHEAVDEVINWSEIGVGPKWLEAKMARQDLRDKYYGLIAQRIREGLPEVGK